MYEKGIMPQEAAASGTTGEHSAPAMAKAASMSDSTGERSAPVASRQAVDLVRMATKAAKLGHGDFIWFGYNPRGHDVKDPGWTAPRLSFGSQGIMITKKAAASIGSCFGTGAWPPGHIDMELLKWAKDERFSGKVGCCWIWPPIGSYAAHESECCFQQVGYRPGLWAKDWISPGTSIDEDPQKRNKTFYKFVAKGHQVPVGEFTRADYSDSMDWCSFWADPPYWENLDTDYKKRMARKQWQLLWQLRNWTSEDQASHNTNPPHSKSDSDPRT